MMGHFVRVTSLFAVFACVGCVSHESRLVPTENASGFINRVDVEGFHCAPVLESDERLISYFDRDLTAWGILPILVYIENRSKKSVEFRVKDIEFGLEDGTEFDQVSVDEVVAAVSYSGWRSTPWWLFLIFPGAVVLGSVSSANETLRDDYAEKALTDRNFPPPLESATEKHQGFVFFRPKGKSLEDCDLSEGSFSISCTTRDAEGRGESVRRTCPARPRDD